MPRTTPSATSAGVASAHAISAFLPPSSSVSALSVAPAPVITARPALTLPMKPILATLRMRDQRRTGVATAGDDIEHAGRKYAVPQLGDAQRRQRRLVGGLDDQRVAGDQRRAALAGDEQQRMVERADARDHSQRLAQRVVERARADREWCRP